MPAPVLRPFADKRMSTRRRPALFRALGRHDAPQAIVIDGEEWRCIEIFKHDSWAATALYQRRNLLIVCKFNRRRSVLGIPMRWLGRLLAGRERRFLNSLAEMRHAPAPFGPVHVAGRHWKNAVARPYLPGHPLAANERVGDDFFRILKRRLLEMHRRGMAYVDLHKRENVLVGDDGRPNLIDFQVCLQFPKWALWCCPPLWLILKAFQRADLYHLQKHVTLLRPDQVDELVSGRVYQRPAWIKVHRWFAVPFRQLRRKLLTWLKIRSDGSATSEREPEDAVRRELAQKEATIRKAA